MLSPQLSPRPQDLLPSSTPSLHGNSHPIQVTGVLPPFRATSHSPHHVHFSVLVEGSYPTHMAQFCKQQPEFSQCLGLVLLVSRTTNSLLKARMKNGILLQQLRFQKRHGIHGLFLPWSSSYSQSLGHFLNQIQDLGGSRFSLVAWIARFPIAKVDCRKTLTHLLPQWGATLSSQPVLARQVSSFLSPSYLFIFLVYFLLNSYVPSWIMHSNYDCAHAILVLLSRWGVFEMLLVSYTGKKKLAQYFLLYITQCEWALFSFQIIFLNFVAKLQQANNINWSIVSFQLSEKVSMNIKICIPLIIGRMNQS